MSKYTNTLTGYVNESRKKPGSYYLTITNISDDPITIEPGEKVFLNKTPDDVKEKYPKVPDFSKSVKVDEATQEDVNPNDVPF